MSGLPAPPFNGLWAHGRDATRDELAALLDDLAASGLPHCLQARPGASAEAGALAETRGLAREAEIPLMVLDDPGGLAEASADGLTVRQLDVGEGDAQVAVAAPAFGAPPELLAELVTPEVMSAPGIRVYLAEVEGEAVATGLGLTLDGAVGIFNIATIESHRQRGYGAAVTARAVRDGLSAGASWAWLQSTPIGYGVYERLGFRTLERWPCWTSPGRPVSEF